MFRAENIQSPANTNLSHWLPDGLKAVLSRVSELNRTRVGYFGLLVLFTLISLLLQGTALQAENAQISNLPIVIFAAAYWFSLQHTPQKPADVVDTMVLALMVLMSLIAGYQMSWLALAALSFYLRVRRVGETRWLQVMSFAALYHPLTTYSLKWFATPLLSIDALVTAQFVQWLHGQGHAVGNLIYGPGDHQLLVLRGCSSLNNLGLSWLILFFFMRLRDLPTKHGFWLKLVLVTSLILAINYFRLYSMAADIEMHAWWHSSLGEWVYQALIILVIAIGVFLSIRKSFGELNGC